MATVALFRRTTSHCLRWIPSASLLSTIAGEAAAAAAPSSADINAVCRILSDFRSPHHDLEPALLPFAPITSPLLVEHVLKRCRNLPSSAHRFFLWSASLPNFHHSPTALHILVDILGAARHFPLIWALLSDHQFPVSPHLFHLLFRSYARAALPADALRAFHRMPDFALHPSLDDLHHLLSSLCRHNLASHAHDFFTQSKSQFPITNKTYTILIAGWAAAGTPTPALQLFDEMLQSNLPVDVVAYNTLMSALCQGGELDEAYRRLKEMRRSHGLEPDAYTYALFIRASCKAKDLHASLKVLETMRRRSLVPNVFTFNCVIKLLCEQDKFEEAYELLDEMIAKGMEPDTWSYNTVLAAHCRLREVNKSLRLLARMDQDGCVPDRHTYNMLMKMLIGVGRMDRAMEVWDGMEERGFYPSASSYAVMIHGLCRIRGSIKEACQYFEMMVDEGIPPYLSTCELLRSQLLQLGMREKVHVLKEKMRRSTSCVIQELSSAMEGSKKADQTLGEEQEPTDVCSVI